MGVILKVLSKCVVPRSLDIAAGFCLLAFLDACEAWGSGGILPTVIRLIYMASIAVICGVTPISLLIRLMNSLKRRKRKSAKLTPTSLDTGSGSGLSLTTPLGSTDGIQLAKYSMQSPNANTTP